MALAAGTKLGPYEIVSPLGAGGMGEVYKARDSRLGRFVAMKILPPAMVADGERKLRFVQEAKAASALSHPNIITIHDVGSEGPLNYMVMEYVTGRPLSEIIPRGGMRLDELLKYAIQISDALAKAHEAGIIHRDLKPANIMVTDDGLVKVLDFGLAKLSVIRDTPASAETQTVDLAGGPLTVAGTVMGTVNYMSPEQAEGRVVDRRSDIFSFGVLLYEMVTGRRAFQGDSTIVTLSAILRDDPEPLSKLVEDAPRDLERLIERCLRKDPNQRAQSMVDVKLALEDLKKDSESGALVMSGSIPAAVQKRRIIPGWLAVVAGAVVIAGIAGWWYWSGGSGEPAPPQPEAVEQTGGSVEESAVPPAETGGEEAADSREGSAAIPRPEPPRESTAPAEPVQREPTAAKSMAAEKPGVAPETDEDDRLAPSGYGPRTEICAMVIGDASPASRKTIIAGSGTSIEPRFSPDGNRIAFSSDRDGKPGIWVAAADGSSLARITSIPGIGARWSPDGKQIAFLSGTEGNTQVYVVSLSSGAARKVTAGAAVHRSPTWSRDGQWIYFGSNQSGKFQVWKVSVSGGEPERVTQGGGAEAFESFDRQTLFFVKPRPQTGIWSMPAGGGTESQVMNAGVEGAWKVTRDGIYFLARINTSRPAVMCLRSRRRGPVLVTQLEGRLPRRRPAFDVSPDGKSLLVALEAETR